VPQQQLPASHGRRSDYMVSNPSPASKACSCGVFLLLTVVLDCILFLLHQRRTDSLRALETRVIALVYFDLSLFVFIFDSFLVKVLERLIDSLYIFYA
jgi:hypothetical protein